MPRNHVYRAEQENPTYDDTTVSLHRVDHNDLKTRKQKVIAMENEIKEPKTMMNVKAMEEELHKLQIENERLEKLLKVLFFLLHANVEKRNIFKFCYD